MLFQASKIASNVHNLNGLNSYPEGAIVKKSYVKLKSSAHRNIASSYLKIATREAPGWQFKQSL